MSMYSVLCCWKRVFATTSAFSWQNSAALCFILYSEVKFACYFRYFLTSYFCILVPYNEKGIFFGCSSLQVNYSIFTYDILGTALNTFISLFFFGHAAWLAESHFPSQELNPSPYSENAES